MANHPLQAVHDPARLAELKRLGVLDTPPEAALDELTRLASAQLAAPIALVSLVDRDRQFFKSCVGLSSPLADRRETPLSHSFCQYVVAAAEPLIVEDALDDPVLATHVAVEELGVRSYLGVPLTTSTGQTVGSFCVVDPSPRTWSDSDTMLLRLLARCAITEMELRAALQAQHRELVQHVDARRSADERLRQLYENTTEGVVVLSASGQILFATEAFTRLTGHPREALLGKNAAEFLAPGNRDLLRRGIGECLANPAVPFTVEYQVATPDGVRYRHAVAVNRLADPTLEGIVLTIRDITEQRRLEEQLRQVQKMEALGRLAGGVAHDFNNLLTIISASVQIAIDDMRHAAPDPEDLHSIRQAADTAASMTRRLLAFSRNQALHPEDVDLSEAVSGLMPLLKRTIPARFAIVPALATYLPAVSIDPSQFEQVVLNLVVNARDAMPNGGRIDIATAVAADVPPTLAARDAGYVVVEVSDTGHGMDAATAARIFEPFFTTKGEGHGTGLGLATVYGIVSQSGGTVTVESEPGRGARFRVYLPAVSSTVH